MKKIACAALGLLLAVQVGYCESGCCLVTDQPYSVNAQAAVVMEASTATLLFAQNSEKKLPMASTTKIMTALLALEAGDLDLPFLADSGAIRVEGSSMGLVQGDTVTLRALAGGMLTASGNDAANAAAVRLAGGLPAFAQQMNRRAERIGMGDTHFVNPSGLTHGEHYSTARDMALLAAEALKNPLFAEMCAAKKLTLHFGNPPYDRTLYNHNRLLSLYPPAMGIKTGFTREAGRCLVSAACRDGVTLIAVTLNCGDDWRVHQALYERYFPMTACKALTPAAPILLPVVGGIKTAVELTQERLLTAVEVGGQPIVAESQVFADYFAYAPIKKGDRLGKIVYYIDNEYLGESSLLAAEDISAAPPNDMRRNKENNLWHKVKEFKRHWGTEASFPGAKPKNMSKPDASP